MTDQSVSSVHQSSRMGRRSLRFQLVLILLALLLVSFVLVAAERRYFCTDSCSIASTNN
jgi:hypothetical protein